MPFPFGTCRRKPATTTTTTTTDQHHHHHDDDDDDDHDHDHYHFHYIPLPRLHHAKSIASTSTGSAGFNRVNWANRDILFNWVNRVSGDSTFTGPLRR